MVTLDDAVLEGDLATGAGNDSVTFASLTISGTSDLGDGDDTLAIIGTGNDFNTIAGGAGSDQVRYTTDPGFAAALSASDLTVNGFELFRHAVCGRRDAAADRPGPRHL